VIRNSRRRASGSTGWRVRPPSTGGTTSCSMSGKPQRRPRPPPNLQASGGRRARRRAHEGARRDDPADAAPADGPGHRAVARARPTRPAPESSGFARLPRPSYDRSLWALRTWLDSWDGVGRIVVGMARQGFDLQLTRYDERGWRATFYTTGMEHSPTSATGTGWERTPWHATQRAAWEALRKAEEGKR
jgi:hypothetical protein